MAIEQAFQIKLKDKDIVEMLNFGLIKDILRDYGIV
jgi:acyl carrier protein